MKQIRSIQIKLFTNKLSFYLKGAFLIATSFIVAKTMFPPKLIVDITPPKHFYDCNNDCDDDCNI